jgi:hypothetical protein
MALNWIQVEREFIEGVEPDEIAEALKLNRYEVIGMVACMWAWSLTYAAPDGIVFGSEAGATARIELSAGWKGKRGRWVAEMVRVGILEVGAAGIRFKGWEARYGKALTETERARMRKRRQRSKEEPLSQNVTRDIRDISPPEGVTEGRDNGRDIFSRERSKKNLEEPENLKPPPPEPSVVAVEFVPESQPVWPPDTPERFLGWVAWERRQSALSVEPKAPAGFREWFNRVTQEHGAAALVDAYFSYRKDKHFADRQWPTAVFIAEGVYAIRLPARSA